MKKTKLQRIRCNTDIIKGLAKGKIYNGYKIDSIEPGDMYRLVDDNGREQEVGKLHFTVVR